MLLPAILVVLWPMATFAGGKIFVPLLFVSGLVFGWRYLVKRPRRDVLTFCLFLIWVCLTALWSPANTPLISGSIWDGDFAIEAAHIRFVLSALGICLFLAVIAELPAEKTARLVACFPVAILLQLAILIVLALQRDTLLVADDTQLFVPSPQSLGRNANLLALVLPVAIGVWVDRFSQPVSSGLSVLVIALAGWVLLAHDALAGLLGWGIGGAIALMLLTLSKSGMRWALNMVAMAIVGAPILATVLRLFVKPESVDLPLSAEQRLVIWQTTLEKIASKPVFGHGVDAVNVWSETYASRPDLLSVLDPTLENARLIPHHTHNMSLQIWAETGLVGALLLAVALVFLGRTMPTPSTLTIGTKIAIAGVMGGAVALFAVAYSAWDESFWASLAVVCCALIILVRQNQSQTR